MDKMKFHYPTGSMYYRVMETVHGFTPQYRDTVNNGWRNFQRIDGSYVECLSSLEDATEFIWLNA